MRQLFFLRRAGNAGIVEAVSNHYEARTFTGMINVLITLLVYLLIVGLIWWAATTIIGVIPLPEPIKTVVNVILIVVLCLIVIYALMGLLPPGGLPLLR